MNYRLSPLQRIGALLSGVFLLVLSGYAAMNGGFTGKRGVLLPALISVFMICFGIVIGCIAIWLAVFQSQRTRTDGADTKQESLGVAGDSDKDSEELVECQFELRHKTARVILDPVNGRIHFVNCFVPFGLLTTTADRFSCAVDDIMRVHDSHVHNLGSCLSIVTRHGKCVVRRIDGDYSELHDVLKFVVPHNNPGFVLHDPRTQTVTGLFIAGSGVAGLLAGCGMVPAEAGDAALFVWGALGAAAGISAAMTGLWLLDRRLQRRHTCHTTGAHSDASNSR